MTEKMALEKAGEKELKEINFEKGVIPKDYNDVLRFAGLIHGAGMAPKGFDTPAKVAVGILTNLEQGRPAVTGLQDLAIINGRCGTYGNAITAKITASGLMDKDYPKETETGTPYENDWKFTYTVKRKGRPAATGVWTWADSKRAGFDKAHALTPWVRFTRRMMQWKARSFVNQDEFGDVLRGMTPVEDLYDIVDLEPGRNGAYGTPEQKASDLTDKIKEKPDYTPKDLKPEKPAEALKKKLDEGDTGIEGYQPLTPEEENLQDVQAKLEEKRRLEQENIGKSYMGATKNSSTGRTQADIEDARKELDVHLMVGSKGSHKPTVDPSTGDDLEQDEPQGILPTGTDAKEWLVACRPSRSVSNAKAFMAVYKEQEFAIDGLDRKIKVQLEKKLIKTKNYLTEVEANKKKTTTGEEVPPPNDENIPPFEQPQNHQESEYDAMGRKKFLDTMNGYLNADHEKYKAVLKDNSTLEKPLNEMNDVEVSDQKVILGFMKVEFDKE